MVNQSLLIVSHDAGGAEILSAWVKKHPDNKYTYVLDGPARSIFSARLGKVRNHDKTELSELSKKVDCVLTSTSWQSELEKETIVLAKKQGVKVVAYLDHWINYKERFDELPDELWVGDKLAESIAKKVFPQTKIRFVENEYFLEIENQVNSINLRVRNDELRLLFLTQPLEKAQKYLKLNNKIFSLTDRDIFDVLKEGMELLKKKYTISELCIRIHPADEKTKYQEWIKEINGISVRFSEEARLLDDCLNADWVIGSYSAAMVIGLLAKRKVFCCLPDTAERLLPHQNILNFKHYVKGLK